MAASAAQLEALARGRAKRGKAMTEDTAIAAGPAAKRKQQGGAWWPWVLLVVLVLVVLLLVGLAVVGNGANASARTRGLVPLRATALTEKGRRIIITRPLKAFVTKETRDKFEQAVASMDPGPAIRVLDASDADGGPLDPHASHDTGIDIDISTKGLRLAEIQPMVTAFLGNGATVVASTIPGLVGTTPWAGHNEHMHVRF